MGDIVDQATRSRMMSGIRSQNTKPEMLIRQALHRQGFRYRLHVASLPGKPDLVFPKYQAVLFIHGCFWHAHDCHYFKIPQTRTDFWLHKLDGNRQRDARQRQALRQQGWRVLIVWECAIRQQQKTGLADLCQQVANWLRNGEGDAQIDEGGKGECFWL